MEKDRGQRSGVSDQVLRIRRKAAGMRSNRNRLRSKAANQRRCAAWRISKSAIESSSHAGIDAGPHFAGGRRLLFGRLVAGPRRRTAGKMHEVLIGAGGTHGAQAPVGRAGGYVRKPILGILRCGAVGIFGAKALAGCCGAFVSGGTHRGFLSAVSNSLRLKLGPSRYPAALGSRSICPAASNTVR